MPASLETLALGTPVAEAGDGLWTYKPHLKTGEAETSTLLDSVQRLQKLGLQKSPDDLTVSAALLLAPRPLPTPLCRKPGKTVVDAETFGKT